MFTFIESFANSSGCLYSHTKRKAKQESKLVKVHLILYEDAVHLKRVIVV